MSFGLSDPVGTISSASTIVKRAALAIMGPKAFVVYLRVLARGH